MGVRRPIAGPHLVARPPSCPPNLELPTAVGLSPQQRGPCGRTSRHGPILVLSPTPRNAALKAASPPPSPPPPAAGTRRPSPSRAHPPPVGPHPSHPDPDLPPKPSPCHVPAEGTPRWPRGATHPTPPIPPRGSLDAGIPPPAPKPPGNGAVVTPRPPPPPPGSPRGSAPPFSLPAAPLRLRLPIPFPCAPARPRGTGDAGSRGWGQQGRAVPCRAPGCWAKRPRRLPPPSPPPPPWTRGSACWGVKSGGGRTAAGCVCAYTRVCVLCVRVHADVRGAPHPHAAAP